MDFRKQIDSSNKDASQMSWKKNGRSSTSRDCIRSCSDLGVAANIVEVLVAVDAS